MIIPDTVPAGLPGIRRQRKALGLSQQELADRIGASRQIITNWETGKSWPLAFWIPILAGALECSADELFRRDEEDGT